MQSYDSNFLDLMGEGSEYRETVRCVIPSDVQQRILAQCGDQVSVKPPRRYWLPGSCAAPIAPDVTAATASALRVHLELVRALTSHMAHVTRHITSVAIYGILVRRLDERITEKRQ